jgi:hypothetical protein
MHPRKEPLKMATQATSSSPVREPRTGNAERSLGQREPLEPVEDLMCYARDYARQQPEMAALWCLGIGFILGWKLRPW